MKLIEHHCWCANSHSMKCDNNILYNLLLSIHSLYENISLLNKLKLKHLPVLSNIFVYLLLLLAKQIDVVR